MTEQEILDGNKLIAEFMGLRGNWLFNIREAKYHSSWDWLQPVAKKAAEYIRVDDTGFNWQKNIYHAIKTFDINEVWEKTVDFIKWYNLNNNK